MNDTSKLQFVLVHGAWHGAWCWEKVVPVLESYGHEAHTLDLPGLGEDPTPVHEVSLDGYVDKVVEVINKVGEPVVLVGHSMGGMVVTQVAEKAADRISTLVYLTAFSPRNGENLLQYAQADEGSLTARYLQVHEDEGIISVPEDKLRECFYGLCSDEDVANAIARLKPQAIAPNATPLELSEENYGRVRRTYIECSEDAAITPSMQQRQKSNGRVDGSITLAADHSPFYSCPEELGEALVALAKGN